MTLTIPYIRANTMRARHLYQRSRRQGFAIGAFNIDNQETLIAVCRAAQKLRAPVMVEVSHGEVKAIGLENIRDMVDNYKVEYGIEMYINLDHSPTVEDCKRAIDAGFEFIHIDISQENHDALPRRPSTRIQPWVAPTTRLSGLRSNKRRHRQAYDARAVLLRSNAVAATVLRESPVGGD